MLPGARRVLVIKGFIGVLSAWFISSLRITGLIARGATMELRAGSIGVNGFVRHLIFYWIMQRSGLICRLFVYQVCG